MPKVKVSTGIELFVEEHGSGPPLVLIHGRGYWRFAWWKQVPFLSRWFRLLLVDLRGAGESDVPPGPYSLPEMAREVADVIAARADGRAHVLGHSLGGFVAQELALSHPDRVNGLVLAGTALGGKSYVLPGPEVLKAFQFDPQLSLEENLRRNIPAGAPPGYFERNPEDLAEILRHRLARPMVAAQLAQDMAAAAWPGAAGRYEGFETPTLVLHGDLDPVVPLVNGRNLAAAIPAAELRLLPGVGHQLFIEAAPMANRAVAQFLQSL